MQFQEADALRLLDAANDLELDALKFGVVRLDQAGLTTFYNANERAFSGLRADHAIGRHFFTQVGACMNNEQVARRYEQEPELDATILNAYLLVER